MNVELELDELDAERLQCILDTAVKCLPNLFGRRADPYLCHDALAVEPDVEQRAERAERFSKDRVFDLSKRVSHRVEGWGAHRKGCKAPV